MNTHEEAFINAFLTKQYRRRCIALKGLPRDALFHELADKLDDRYTYWLPNNVYSAKRILRALRLLYPTERGYLISAYEETDGLWIMLSEFSDAYLDATIVSFVPGKLAYYTAEDGWCPTPRCLLAREQGLQAKIPGILEQVSSYYREHDSEF